MNNTIYDTKDINKFRPRPDANLCIDMDPEDIDSKFIEQAINYHKKNRLDRYKSLKNYYEGYNENIISRSKKTTASDMKLVTGYANYIVTLHQGMLVGNPVSYSGADEDLMLLINEILNLNDEQDKNSELVKNAGIYGEAFEVCYINNNADFRFNVFEPQEVIIIYNNDLNPDRIAAIRYYDSINPLDINGEKVGKAELYTANYVKFFENIGDGYVELEDKRIIQYLDEVPVHTLVNNSEKMGDFEIVIPLIDGVDIMYSDSLNAFVDDVDAFLVLGGMLNADDEDIADMKDNQTILLGENQKAEFLVKSVTNDHTLNQIREFDKAIHKFSHTIDIADESFANNMSGVAMKWKLFVMQQVQANKKRKLKRFLQNRLRMMVKYINLFGYDYNYTDIDIHFKDNLPINEKEQVEMVSELINIVSTSTALSRLDCVEDVQKEIEKIEEENNSYYRIEELEDELLREETSETEVNILDMINRLPEDQQQLAIEKIKSMRDD